MDDEDQAEDAGTADPRVKEGKARNVEEFVEHWFFETFHGSVVARSTEVWNAVHAAKEDLKRRLADLLAEV